MQLQLGAFVKKNRPTCTLQLLLGASWKAEWPTYTCTLHLLLGAPLKAEYWITSMMWFGKYCMSR